MGARMKKPLWVLFFFVMKIVINEGIEICVQNEFVESSRQADMWELNCDELFALAFW